jgi:S1-C subfamily serine protease
MIFMYSPSDIILSYRAYVPRSLGEGGCRATFTLLMVHLAKIPHLVRNDSFAGFYKNCRVVKYILQIQNILFIGAFLFPALAEAQSVKFISYTSGTGFFVTHDGHILTNNHIISNCDKISVHGDGMSAGAVLVARDEENDLALLKAAFTSPNMAYFNSMKQPLKANDPVVIIGYPGESWRGHDPVIRESTIIDLKGPTGEEKWLQFNDSVQHGNSGGPLLDSTGNVVGVVVAKSELHIKKVGSDAEETIKKSDIAISLPTVKNFLELNNVQYQTADSGIYLSADRVNDRARPFIVNVHCRVAGQ